MTLCQQAVVVKFGGHAIQVVGISTRVLRGYDLAAPGGAEPVVVRNGGPDWRYAKQITIQSNFVNGLRTDAATISVVEMVLAGGINKALVAAIHSAGGRAVVLSGKDGQ